MLQVSKSVPTSTSLLLMTLLFVPNKCRWQSRQYLWKHYGQNDSLDTRISRHLCQLSTLLIYCRIICKSFAALLSFNHLEIGLSNNGSIIFFPLKVNNTAKDLQVILQYISRLDNWHRGLLMRVSKLSFCPQCFDGHKIIA